MNFRKNLMRLREEAGYKTANSFADYLGIPRSTYATYESPSKPREPKYTMLCKIADSLHVTIDELLGYEPNVLEKCREFVRNAGVEINEVSPVGCTTININLKELEKISPISLLPVNDFYKAFPSGIVPTAIPNEKFVKIISDAAADAERAVKPSRIAIMKNSLYLSFLAQIGMEIQNMKRQGQNHRKERQQ